MRFFISFGVVVAAICRTFFLVLLSFYAKVEEIYMQSRERKKNFLRTQSRERARVCAQMQFIFFRFFLFSPFVRFRRLPWIACVRFCFVFFIRWHVKIHSMCFDKLAWCHHKFASKWRWQVENRRFNLANKLLVFQYNCMVWCLRTTIPNALTN